MKNGLDAAYDHCQELTRREAKNFYYGFILLPQEQRRAIYAAYAFARRGDRARQRAADLGIALQLTNILRDVREDAERGRIYLPEDEIGTFGYSPEELLAGRVTPAFRKLMAFQCSRAQEYYESGRKLLPYLPRRARACVGAMAGIYRSILEEIARDPAIVFRRRVSLSTGQKLALAGRELVLSVVA